jgi:hypothetical protein
VAAVIAKAMVPVSMPPPGRSARVVQPAALFAGEGAADDELGHRGDVAQLEQVAVHEVVPVVLADLFLEHRDAPRGALEARSERTMPT